MRYQIVHTTTYTYDKLVNIAPHLIRLQPRSDVCQTLHSFALEVVPEPAKTYAVNDLEGNTLIYTRFREQTDKLCFKAISDVETHRTNPFDFFLEPWATQLPIDYPASLLTQLQPYFQRDGLSASVDSVVTQLAQEVCQAVNGNTVSFLTELNQQIYQNCKYIVRETGDPFPAALTWNHKLGSCRDLAVLFMEACRAIGIAARFASGYQSDSSQEPELHAWTEIYLPGAGWRGYDPTNSIAVSDRHITLVASTLPRYAAPISGSFQGGGLLLEMRSHLSIEPYPTR